MRIKYPDGTFENKVAYYENGNFAYFFLNRNGKKVICYNEKGQRTHLFRPKQL
jgi:hypothetical protein